MKLSRSILAAGLVLAGLTASVSAVTLPPTDDSFSASSPSTPTKRMLKSANGKATTLPVSFLNHAFIRFGAGQTGIPAAAVSKATLTIYLPKVTRPGGLDLALVTEDWTESYTGITKAEPAFGASFGSILVDSVVAKEFIMINVTDQVKGWLTHPATDFGFAILTPSNDRNAKVLVGSKEGSGSGYPAMLDIETTAGPYAGGDLILPAGANLGIGTATPAFPIDITGNSAAISLTQTGSDGVGVLQQNSQRSFFTGIFGGSDRYSIYDFTDVENNIGPALERFSILPNGQVGIGTNNPGFSLEVAGEADTQIAIRSTSVNGRVYSFQSSDGGAATGDGSFQIIDRTVGASRFFISKAGNVGIGASLGAPPTARLDVRGSVKLGSTGQFFATGGSENLRVIRGSVSSGGTILQGAGFTVVRNGVGDFTINITTAFADVPAVTASAVSPGFPVVATVSGNPTAGSFGIRLWTVSSAALDTTFDFIAAGQQ